MRMRMKMRITKRKRRRLGCVPGSMLMRMTVHRRTKRTTRQEIVVLTCDV
jgi:hypothetical protein